MDVDRIVPLFVFIGNLCVRTWFCIVETFAVDVLFRTLSIDQCIRRILQTEQKVVLSHSRSLATLLQKKSREKVCTDIKEMKENTKQLNDAVSEKLTLMSCAPNRNNYKHAGSCIEQLLGFWTHEDWDSPWCRRTPKFHDSRRSKGHCIWKHILRLLCKFDRTDD